VPEIYESSPAYASSIDNAGESAKQKKQRHLNLLRDLLAVAERDEALNDADRKLAALAGAHVSAALSAAYGQDRSEVAGHVAEAGELIEQIRDLVYGKQFDDAVEACYE